MPQTATVLAYQSLTLPDKSKIAYLDEGPRTAPVLLFLHGLGDDALIWRQTFKAFSGQFRCIAPDLPGHGKTAAGNFGFRMFDFANLTESFLKALNIKSITLIGHSMGGQIGIILGLRLPAIIDKLVLVATAGFEQFSAAEKMMLQAGMSFRNLPDLSRNEALTAKTIRHNSLNRCMTAMLEEPVFEHLRQLTVPALVIFGEQDGFIPNRFLHPLSTTDVARAGSSQIPDAELHIFGKCGHYPQNEQPKLFNQALQHFLIQK